jgi:hypothetical protein
MVIMGLAAGAVVSFLLGFNAIQKHTVIISSSLANHGVTMGGFLCYLILGEHGLALSFIFITYFMPYVYTGHFFRMRGMLAPNNHFFTKQHHLYLKICRYLPYLLPSYSICKILKGLL